MATKNWTNEQIATIDKLWREGKTGGEIARHMGKTRCAVMGFAHRHLSPRKKKQLEPHPRVAEHMSGQA